MAGGKQSKKTAATIVAFVIGQGREGVTAKNTTPLKTVRSFPTYASHLPSYTMLRQIKKTIDGTAVIITVKAVPPENILVEASVNYYDIFGPNVLAFRDKMIDAAEAVLFAENVKPDFKEEFTLFCVKSYRGDPKQFFSQAGRIAAMVKSENIELSQQEIDKTLNDSSLQYAKDDLTIVDWDGAWLFDAHGDWEDAINILEIANVNLLRLRHLDRLLDERLDGMNDLLHRVPKISSREVRKMMTELLRLRTQSIVEFEHAERDIQLIGDWYAGRLYGLASKKLHLERWRQSIREVLKSLEDMSSVAAENFTVTTERRVEQVQQLLWYVQLIGWFILLYLEGRLFFK